MTVTCQWCGGAVDPTSTCPRSIDCPDCHAQPGHPCKRPSGHRADQLHAARVERAEALDAAASSAPAPGQLDMLGGETS